MCGIAGVINYQQLDLDKFIEALSHRGPDEKSIYKEEAVALLHTRLSIQDVAHGHQPFHYASFTIVFNGEIYNHLELRKHLAEFSFKTQSDTETLLYLFVKFGVDMFDYLDGMFAFCIYDKAKGQLILARDRAGKKPLYYYSDERHFIFSSELNALKTVKPLAILPDAINGFLRAGFFWTPSTPYQKVFKLEAATYFVVDTSTLQLTKTSYFNLLNFYALENRTTLSFAEATVELEKRLQKSVADRVLASEVDVGVFLSGGIDSSLVVAMAAQLKPHLKTFTMKFEGLYDESPLAKLTAEKYNTDHTELFISPNLPDEIEKILLAYGEPFMDSSAIPSYYVAREASHHVKVILNGDGADELFGGYRRYVPLASRLTKYLKWISPLVDWLPAPRTKQSLYNYFYRLLAMLKKQGLDFYLSATSDIYEDAFTFPKSDILFALSHFIEKILHDPTLTPLSQMLYLDFNILLFCDLLVKMDIATMSNSLEGRSPFLSKYMLEFAPTLPDHYKVNGTTTKVVLRELAKKYLPPSLIQQPKRGFEVPLKKWIDEDLRAPIFDSLRSGCYAENFIDRKFIQALLANKIKVSSEKRAKILWGLFCLEVWHKHE